MFAFLKSISKYTKDKNNFVIHRPQRLLDWS